MTTAVTASLPGDFTSLVFPAAPTARADAALVWLHGIGERGGDLNLVCNYGLPAVLAQRRATMTATVLCPQLEPAREWEPERVAALMAHVREQYAHSALMGFSLGAFGICETLAVLGPQSDMHVAIAPSMQRFPAVAQTGTRLLSISGEHDRWPKAGEYLQRLRSLGAEVEEVVLPNEGHFISESALWHPSSVAALRALGICLTPADKA